MSCTTLRFLAYEMHASCPDGLAYALGFVPDDDINVFVSDHTGCRCDHVRQQRLATNFVQDLRMF